MDNQNYFTTADKIRRMQADLKELVNATCINDPHDIHKLVQSLLFDVNLLAGKFQDAAAS